MLGKIFWKTDKHHGEITGKQDWQSNATASRTGGCFIRRRVLHEQKFSLEKNLIDQFCPQIYCYAVHQQNIWKKSQKKPCIKYAREEFGI